MTTIDFDRVIPRQIVPGMMFIPQSDARYVTLWRHKPGLNTDGVVQKAVGTIATDRFPQEDWPGLIEMAVKNGWFPWKPGDDPDLSAYRMHSVTDKHNREEVIKAWTFYSEKYGESVPEEPETEDEVQPVETVSAVHCLLCDWFAPLRNRRGRDLTEKEQRNTLRMHGKTHKKL